MASTYKKIPIQDVLDSHPEKAFISRLLFDTHPITNLLQEGCYIAGGFGRALLNGSDLSRYLGSARIGNTYSGQPGDIDIFFSDSTKAEQLRSVFNTDARSFGKNALETRVAYGIRVQLVDGDDLILPMEEQMDRFDFTNACVAITRDHFIVHEKFEAIERDKLLDVKRCSSPFLGSRIMKYFNYRGLSGVTPESEPVITEWIMRALSMNFDVVTKTNVERGAIDHALQRVLSEGKLTRADDLLLALGKFRTTVKEQYGVCREVDFALHNLKERGYDVSVPTF